MNNNQQHELALTIPCLFCHAPKGQQCINTINGQPLSHHLPAHFLRLKAAQQTSTKEEPF